MFWMILTVLLSSLCAYAQPSRDTCEKLAARFAEAKDVNKYLMKVWRCPKGVCPNSNLARDLKRLRSSAISQCGSTWYKDPGKGERCKQAIGLTPKVFSSPHIEPSIQEPAPASNPDGPIHSTGPPKDPRETPVSKPVDCLDYTLQGPTLYVCQDGRAVGNPNDCARKPMWWAIIFLIAYGAFVCFVFPFYIYGRYHYRNKWIDENAKVAQLQQEAEERGNIAIGLQKKLEKLETLPTVSIPPPPPKPPTGETAAQPELPAEALPVEAPGGTMLGIVDPNVTLPPPADNPPADAKAPGRTLLGIVDPNTALPAESAQAEQDAKPAEAPRELPISPTPSAHEHTIMGIAAPDADLPPEPLTAEPSTVVPDKLPIEDGHIHMESAFKNTVMGQPAAPPTPTTTPDDQSGGKKE